MTTRPSPDSPAPAAQVAGEPAPGLGRRVFGDLAWQRPAWITAADARVRAHPRRYLGGFFGVLAMLLLGGWWATRPPVVHPGALGVFVHAPAVTDYSVTPKRVDTLRLDFSGSAAPIADAGKAPHGVTLTPALAGSWQWQADRALVFTPADDWPVGQAYTIELDQKSTLAPGVHLAQDKFEYEASSAAFVATLASSSFYQDPLDPKLKKGVFELTFSHPVDPKSLPARITLALKDGAGTAQPTPGHVLSFDERRLKGWIHSDPLAIPDNGGTLDLKLAAGVASALGGPGNARELQGRVVLPSLYSVAVDSAVATLVENDRYEPEQVVVLGFNNAMRDTEVAAATSLWLLPERNPRIRPQDHPAGPWHWSEGEVDEAILRQSQRLPATALPAEREYIETHSLRYNAPPGRFLYLRVDKGLKAFGGYLLGKPFAAVREVPQYPTLLRFLGEGALLSLQGERRVSLVARNLPRARLEIGRLLPDQLQHLAFLNNGSFAKPSISYPGDDSLVEREELRLRFDASDPAKAQYQGVDLGKFLAPGRRGIFLLSLRTMSEYDESQNAQQTLARNAGEEMDTRMVVLTDLGLIAKKALDGQRDVFVQSLATGRPVAGAQVRAVARNGETLVEATTDADGRARLPSLNDFRREKQPTLLTVGKDGDFSFLPLSDYGRTLDYSRFDIGGEPNRVDAGSLKAMLFSDRGLYRPGDTLHLGMIVRAADWDKPLDGLPLELELTDPRGNVARRQRLRLSATGFEEFAFTPSDSAPSGNWSATLYLIGRNDSRTSIGETTVQVREFAPDTMRVRATLSSQGPGGWIKPNAVAATVVAENLFGTPAQKRKVEGTIVLRPAFPAFPAYPGYVFHDPQLAKDGYDEKLGDQSTDDSGKAVFKIDLSKYARATYQLNFLARAFEPGSGRNVAAQAGVLVSSNDFLVGIKAGDDLGYVKRKAPRSVQLLAIGPDGKPRAVAGLHAVVVEKRYVSVLTKQDSGLYRYVSHERKFPTDDRVIALPAVGLAMPLPTGAPGNFALELRDADGTVLNTVDYSVAGAANLTRSLERNAELSLALDKPRYKPGETIEVSIRAPYTGSGLITIERDKVVAQAWFHADTTSSVQHVQLPADFEGNGYVNVQFLRDPASDEVFMSPLSFGVAAFAVDRSARTQPLSLTVPKMVKPGAPITVELKTQGKARVAVFAVDEGILQVARYKVGDPLDFFFTKKMLQVDTAQILDLLLPEFSKLTGMAAPGGDGSGDLAKNLNPFKRKAEKPAVWWSGLVDVDGAKTLTFRLPDHFNGRVRVTAVAVSAQKLGIAETGLTVRGDFVLTPTLPTHVAPGDEFELPVGVANTIDGATAPSNVTVTLQLPPSLTLVGAAPGPVRVAPGDEATVRFRLRAGQALGAAAVGIGAADGAHSARRRIELSLRPAIVARQQLQIGQAVRPVQLDNLRAMYGPLSTRELRASPSALVAVDGLSAYLRDYPHLCTEQLVSEAMPALVFATRPELGHKVERNAASGALIDVLRSRQNAEGGLGLWYATPDADPFVSGYAALYLVEARDRGVPVPGDLLASLDGYLETLAADPSRNDLPYLRQRAMAVYLLVRQGRSAGNLLAAVQQQLQRDQPQAWADDAAGMLVAASYQLLQQDQAARPLAARGLARVNAAQPPAFDYGYYYDPGIEQAWTLYLLQRHFPALAAQVKPVAVQNLFAPLRNNRYNTLYSALTVLALDAQAGAPAAAALPALQAQDKSGARRNIGQRNGIVVAGRYAPTDPRVFVFPAADAPAWYLLNQTGFDLRPPAATQSKGLEVLREYLDDAGQPITTLRLGQEVTVRLRVRALGAKARGEIAITDLLPGGFEAVLQPKAAPAPVDPECEDCEAGENGEMWVPPLLPLALPGSTMTPNHIELREDRVVFYGFATDSVQEFRYRVRANNVGAFVVPPIYGESMYDRGVYAQGGPAGTLKVVAPTP